MVNVVSNKKNEAFSVRFVNEAKDFDQTIQVQPDEYIYDAAVAQGVEIPVSCCAGVCITCAGKLVEGNVEHDHNFLQPQEIDAGFLLTCRSYAQSNCVIMTHQEDELLDL